MHQLPPPLPDFAGREAELHELLDVLSHGGVTIAGLRGLGGIGKTTLALVLAHHLKERYPDAQLFLDLQGTNPTPLTPTAVMTHVIHAYQPDASIPGDGAKLQGLYRSVLHDQRTLLLFDNVADAAQIEPLIPPPTCVLLVTSRRHIVLPGLYIKDLDTLPPNDAQTLLLCIAPRIDDHQAAKIAQLCGYLPLALRLAGSALAEQVNLAPADYVRRLTDAQQRLHLIEAAISLSYNLLGTDLQWPWRQLAVFPTTFDYLAVATVWGSEIDDAQVLNMLSKLVATSMLEWDATTERYAMHELVRLFADSRLSDDERTASQQRHAEHYRDVLAVADHLYVAAGEDLQLSLRIYDVEWANIVTGHTWAMAHVDTIPKAVELCSDYPIAGTYLLGLRQHPRECIIWYSAALAAARRLGDHTAVGHHLGNLGTAHGRLGDLRRAIEYFEQYLAVVQETGNRQGEGIALMNLGGIYFKLGERQHAMDYYERSLAIMREVGDRRSKGYALQNLGTIYSSVGEVKRALDYSQQALAITYETGDRQGESNVFGSLGDIYFKLGDVQQAIKSYEQQLAIGQELGDRRSKSYALQSLGRVYSKLGEVRRAIDCYEQALAVAREIGDRQEEGYALDSLGNAHFKLGEVRRAIDCYEQALAIARETEDRQRESNILGSLGKAYFKLGDVQQAIKSYEQQLAIAQELGNRQGESHALGNVAIAHFKLGEVRRAIDCYEQALAVAREIGDRQAEAQISWNLGLAYQQQGDFARALVHLQSCADIEQEMDHPDAAKHAAYVALIRQSL